MKKIFMASIFVFSLCVFSFGQDKKVVACPAISVTGPSTVVQIGETATFTVSVTGNSAYNPEYVWAVSEGKIIEGQGTETIAVEISTDSSPLATVEVKGLPEGCENTVSEYALTGCPPASPVLLDEFEISSKINPARLDAVISQLENSPDDAVYIIIYPHEKDPLKKLESREDYVKNYLLKNNVGSGRMIFARANGGEFELDDSVIRIWRVPQGANVPAP